MDKNNFTINFDKPVFSFTLEPPKPLIIYKPFFGNSSDDAIIVLSLIVSYIQ